jgi:hypothetical protein
MKEGRAKIHAQTRRDPEPSMITHLAKLKKLGPGVGALHFRQKPGP